MMNKVSLFLLKVSRKIYSRIIKTDHQIKPSFVTDPDVVSALIFNALQTEDPCMIARFGSTELTCVVNYLGTKEKSNALGYIMGTAEPWWWEAARIDQMKQWSGFFTPTIPKIEQFCELMLNDMPEVNILGSWLPQELRFAHKLKDAVNVDLELLNPYFSKMPWTRALEGKKVLVVHPFAATIKKQYENRELLFKNNLLPAFHLETIQAIQSIAEEETNFKDWFEALNHMKNEIDSHDYDICLIGCGAYGFPLAAHVKRMGKKSVHIGGSLQLLFGISGKRWENENYNAVYNYSKLINEHWVKPGESERPRNANMVEGACYW